MLLKLVELLLPLGDVGFALLDPQPGVANPRVEFRFLRVEPRFAAVDVGQPLLQSVGQAGGVLGQHRGRRGDDVERVRCQRRGIAASPAIGRPASSPTAMLARVIAAAATAAAAAWPPFADARGSGGPRRRAPRARRVRLGVEFALGCRRRP